MAKKQDSGEGVFITIGLLIVLLCVAGSLATHKDVMNVFLVLIFIVLNLVVLAAIIIGLISVFIYVFKRDANDPRSFFQIFKQEYSNNHLVDTYKLFLRHLGEYLGETETYKAFVRHATNFENRFGWIFKPFYRKKVSKSDTDLQADGSVSEILDKAQNSFESSAAENDLHI